MSWAYHTDGSPVHIWPQDDLIEHDTADDEGGCACGPRTEPVEQDGGGMGWIIVHHSLDGREQFESS